MKVIFALCLVLGAFAASHAEEKKPKPEPSYPNLLSRLGLTEKEQLPEGLLDTLKTLSTFFDKGPRPDEEVQEEVDQWLDRGEDIKNYTIDAFRHFFQRVGHDPIEYIGVVLDAPLNIVATLIEKAPFSYWKKVYKIYTDNPELIMRAVRANKRYFFGYMGILASYDDTKKYLKKFIDYSHIFEGFVAVAEVLNEDDSEDEIKRLRKEMRQKEEL